MKRMIVLLAMLALRSGCTASHDGGAEGGEKTGEISPVAK